MTCKKCKSYNPDNKDECKYECKYLDMENYGDGTSRYCTWFNLDIYNIKDCPVRPKYLGEA